MQIESREKPKEPKSEPKVPSLKEPKVHKKKVQKAKSNNENVEKKELAAEPKPEIKDTSPKSEELTEKIRNVLKK